MRSARRRVEEVRDGARVRAEVRAEFEAGAAAASELCEHAKLNGSEQDLGRPERKRGLQNRARVQLGFPRQKRVNPVRAGAQ